MKIIIIMIIIVIIQIFWAHPFTLILNPKVQTKKDISVYIYIECERIVYKTIKRILRCMGRNLNVLFTLNSNHVPTVQ